MGTPARVPISTDCEGVSVVKYRPIPSHPLYSAGDDGSIVGKSGKLLNPQMSNAGYYQFGVYETGRCVAKLTVHFAVCEAFHGLRPAGAEVAHRNGIRTDNRAVNLRWRTRSENALERHDHGTMLMGEDHPHHKLTENAVREIRRVNGYRMDGFFARKFGVSAPAVRSARLRKTWRHI
jgi:hypothetical protein